ncbi:hypothetical protein EFK75_26750, partial [Escherichia coli]|nr:hypothetical protein [Escherichia coli]
TDNGSCYRANETRQFARMLGLEPKNTELSASILEDVAVVPQKAVLVQGTTAAWRLQIENRPGSSCCCRTPRRICML